MLFQKGIKFLSSLKLAVIVMVSICTLVAIGTIVESKYDADIANKLVYRTFWMWGVLSLLAVNLTAVMVSRWPWKKRHIAFVSAHIGILLLLLGSWLTQRWGLDGSMRVEINKSSQFVVTGKTELSLFSEDQESKLRPLFKKNVDFFLNQPQKKTPFILSTGYFDIQVIDYKNYVIPQVKITSTKDKTAGAGLRYQLFNSRVNHIDWILQNYQAEMVTQNLGPAQVILAPPSVELSARNAILLNPLGEKIQYKVFHKNSSTPYSQGTLREGDVISLGWMDLKLKILRFFNQAESQWEIQEKERPTPLTVSAIKVKYLDREKWMVLNDMMKIEHQGKTFRLFYAQERLPLDFSIQLNKFEIERYQGTRKAAEYKSLVEVPGEGQHLISMNEPLKIKGLLVYQASFEEDARGEPTASVFSVNYDPGRWLKYFGSLLMSIGIILLFYFKKI